MHTEADCFMGTSEARLDRINERRHFVELKRCFMLAAAALPGIGGQHLQTLVRHASEPIELWLIRPSLLTALAREGEAGQLHITRVQLALQAQRAAVLYPAARSPCSA